MQKNKVAILGATGAVGQVFAALLKDHPWFELVAATASDKSVGSPFFGLAISPTIPNLPCEIVFSALDASVAGKIEREFADAGYTVISNARNHRLDPEIPLIVPEINGEKIKGSKIITCPNCSTVGLSLALKPLADQFGIEAVHVVTMQAVSGAGKRVPDIEDNIIPYIPLEEEKIVKETQKILGLSFPISASCNRVNVSDGHLASVSVKLKKKASPQDLIKAWESYPGLNLPSAPKRPLHYFEEESYPQPKLHRNLERGMAVSIGRLRSCPIFDYKFTILSHNTIRGAAGGAILTAEQLIGTPLAFPSMDKEGLYAIRKEKKGAVT